MARTPLRLVLGLSLALPIVSLPLVGCEEDESNETLPGPPQGPRHVTFDPALDPESRPALLPPDHTRARSREDAVEPAAEAENQPADDTESEDMAADEEVAADETTGNEEAVDDDNSEDAPTEAVAGDAMPAVPEIAAPELHEADGLALERLVLTPEITDREPSAPATRFASTTERIYAFVQLANNTDAEKTVHVTFERPSGGEISTLDLTIPPQQSRWRTWAFSRQIRSEGRWTAVVRAEGGALLGRAQFDVYSE